MPRKKGTKKTGGRKKGTPNKLTDSVKDFLEAVLTNDEAIDYARKFVKLRGKNTKTAATVFMRLLAYRFGNPKELHEVTGPEGGAIEHVIRFVGSEKNES